MLHCANHERATSPHSRSAIIKLTSDAAYNIRIKNTIKSGGRHDGSVNDSNINETHF
jgi:hypothetical protein